MSHTNGCLSKPFDHYHGFYGYAIALPKSSPLCTFGVIDVIRCIWQGFHNECKIIGLEGWTSFICESLYAI